MTKTVLTVLFGALTLFGGDVTGTWSGMVKMKRDGADQSHSAHLVLKQEGSAVSGSIGTHADDLRPIDNGKIQGDQIIFDVSTNDGNFRISLKLQEGGETLAGDVRREGTETVAQLELKRSK